jgi:hypothetical protein
MESVSGVFMRSQATVARPVGETPSIPNLPEPDHLKCSDHARAGAGSCLVAERGEPIVPGRKSLPVFPSGFKKATDQAKTRVQKT